MKTPSLRSSTDFARVLAGGTRRRSGAVQIAASPREAGLPSRLGLAVRAPRAVDRNRARRRLRAAAAPLLPGSGWDVVIRSDGAAAKRDFQQLEEDVKVALVGVTQP